MLKTQDLLILGAALLAMAFSIVLWFGFVAPANHDAGVFVGIWVPSILGFGIYVQMRAARI